MRKILCEWHDFPLNHIRIYDDKVKLICEECIIDILDNEQQLNNICILSVKKASNSPMYLLSKSKVKKNFPQFFSAIEQLDQIELGKYQSELENKIKTIQMTLDSIKIELNAQIRNVLEVKNGIIQEIRKMIKFEQIQEIFQQLDQQNDNMNPDIVTQIEQKFLQQFQQIHNLPIQNLKKEINGIVVNHIKVLQEMQGLNQFSIQFNDFNVHYNNFITQVTQNYDSLRYLFTDSRLLSSNFTETLKKQIEQKSKKLIKTTQLIFQCSWDYYFNSRIFWEQINGKSNLLMVFKSKNNAQIFGGYSPCMWQQNLNDYVQDDTLSSFLFSQTCDLILPLKTESKRYAIFSDQNDRIIFGHDMFISSNLYDGYLRLGNDYSLEERYQDYSHTLLFGVTQPKIVECEIFEITLL